MGIHQRLAPNNTPYLDRLFDYVRDRHPRCLRGIEEAEATAPERFPEIAEMFLGWLVAVRGEGGIAAGADAFVRFTTEVNIAQFRYEAAGHYEKKSFAQVYANHYSQHDAMVDYAWGGDLTNFLWAHHVELSVFYRDYFLARLCSSASLVEIAPGHGGWGVWALNVLPQAHLQGFDISASAVEIATAVSRAAAVSDRAVYEVRGALNLTEAQAESADGAICRFLLEHLQNPDELLNVVKRLLKPGGIAFLTGALTAAQVDHIYEYRRESELIHQCEEAGFRVIGSLSVGPKRTFPNAQFLPRAMALLVQKRVNAIF
jgi:ubiquinone/menaquinone biosynthesis C-methylase UbiE